MNDLQTALHPPGRRATSGHASPTLRAALTAVGERRPVILLDRFAEVGHMFIAADHADPEALNFMARRARGIICLCLPADHCDALGLAPLDAGNPNQLRSSLTVSIEARYGVTTGISVADRARTIRAAIDDGAAASDLVVPGHVFPLRALPGGVLERPSHVEAAIELPLMAGFRPAGVVCQILGEDGSDAGAAELGALARANRMPMLSVDDLVRYRSSGERLLESIESTRRVATSTGACPLHIFQERFTQRRHLVLEVGDVADCDEPPVWLYGGGEGEDREFGEPSPGIDRALRRIATRGAGILVGSRNGDSPTIAAPAAVALRDVVIAEIATALGIERFRVEVD